MATFQVIMPHYRAECRQAIEEMLDHDPNLHSQVLYGCHFGEHTGYAVIEASSEEEARAKIPRTMRKRARVVPVEHVSPEDVALFHEDAA